MTGNINNEKEFYVVQFIELPFEGIDDYVCVPHKWVIQTVTAQTAIVAYPNDEDPSVTRDRVKRKGKFKDDWKFYVATFKYNSNTYTKAEQWIMKTNKYGTLVEKYSKTSDTQPGCPLNKKLRSVNQNHSPKFNDNPQKSLPKKILKRPAPSDLNKQLNGKQMKLSDAAQSSSVVATDSKTESNPRFSLNKKLHSVNQNQSSKFNDDSRKPLPIKLLKPPVLLDLKEQLNETQMKVSDAAQSSNAVVTDGKTVSNPRFPLNKKLHNVNRNHSLKFNEKRRAPLSLKKQLNGNQIKLSDAAQSCSIIQNSQSMEYAQTDEAAASIENESTERRTPTQRTEQNIEALSLPVINDNEPPEAIVIDEENYSQDIKRPDKKNSQSHLVSNTTAVSWTPEDPLTSAKQMTEPNKYNNQEHMSDAAQSSNVVVTDGKIKSNRERLIINNQSMECAQTDEAASSIENESTERRTPTQRTEKNMQALSLPVINDNEPPEAIVIDEENYSPDIKKPDKKNSQSHLVSNTTAVSLTPEDPLTSAKQMTEPNKYNNQEHMSDAAQSSNVVVTDGKTKSNRERLIINNQSMECAQTDEAASSIENESTERRTPTQRAEQDIQALNLPIIDDNEVLEVIVINGENYSKDIKKRDKKSSQSHLVCSTTAVSMTLEEPPTSTEQTTQLNQYNNQEHMSDAAQSSNVVLTNGKTKSNRDRLIIIQNNQSMECAQTDEAAASIENESTERMTPTQRAEQNIQAMSLPVINDNEPPEHIVIDEENYSQGVKKPDKKNSQSNLVSNTTAVCTTPKEPPTSSEQTTQPKQYNNKEHILYSTSFWKFKPRIENVRSVANVHNDHELLFHEISNNTQSTSHDTLSSVKKSAQLYNHINGVRRLVSTQTSVENEIYPININKDLAVATENLQSNLMDHTASSSARSAEKQLSLVFQKHSQDGLLIRETQTGNSEEQIGPLGSCASSFEKTQSVPKSNGKPHDVTFVNQRNVFLNASNIANQGKCLIASPKNSYQPTNPNSIQKDLPRESIDNNMTTYDVRPNSPIIWKRITSTGINSTNPSIPLYLTSELPLERQSQRNQQELQRQLQILKGEQRYISNIATQGKNLMDFHQNKFHPTHQNSFQQDLLKECNKSNKYDHQPISQTIRKRTPYTGQNSTYSSIPMYLTAAELPLERQSQRNQQELQRQLQILKGEQRYISNIATKGKNQMVFHQNPSFHQNPHFRQNPCFNQYPYQPTYPNSYQPDLLKKFNESNKYDHQPNSPTIRYRPPYTGPNSTYASIPLYLTADEIPQQKKSQPNQQDLQRQPQIPKAEQLLQSLQNHLNVRNNVPQIDEWLEKETLPPNHGVNSVANTVKNNKVNEMSKVDAIIETMNNFYCNEIDSRSRCVDRPIAAQNSTLPNCQTHPRVVLGQKMLKKFSNLLTQMSDTLHHTRDIYNYLESSIRETANLYEELLGAVNDFNTEGYSTPTNNLAPEVSQPPVERHITHEVPPRSNSSNDNQNTNDVTFVLPP